MWQYNNIEELYHFGILGMKWGHKKNIHPTNYKKNKKEYKKKQKEYKKQQKLKRAIERNNEKVEMYGKRGNITRNNYLIAKSTIGMNITNSFIKSFGKSSMNAIAQNPNIGNGALHAAGALTVTAMATNTIGHIKRISNLVKDSILTKNYDNRKLSKNKR